MKLILVLILYFSLIACGSFAGKETIGDLKQTVDEKSDLSIQNIGYENIREEYQELLDLVDNQYLKEQIERRIAGVYMLESEQDLLSQNTRPKQGFYNKAIKSYTNILKKYPNSKDNAEVLYQLAKAYEMKGLQTDALLMLTQLVKKYPNFLHIAEAYFRVGDIHFKNNRYRKAGKAYSAITKLSVEKLQVNAHYMLGWAYYKQGFYNDSLDAFAYVLDRLLAKSRSLSKTEKPLVKDTLHSISLALINTGGAQQIQNIGGLEAKPYVWMVYGDLGEFFLEKERYEDSAMTFRSFVSRHTHSDKAPSFHIKLINAYIKGNFPHQVLEEKAQFIDYYGLHSKFWIKSKKQVKTTLKPHLKKYIEELAHYHYSKGQQDQTALAKMGVKHKQYNDIREKSIAAFTLAARYYQEYADTFPKDKGVTKMLFLKAEAHFAAFQYDQAADAYEKVAYENSGNTNAAKAGYAAIISYQKHAEKLKSNKEDIKRWQQRTVASMLRFAAVFHNDKRSPSVLTNAAGHLFDLDRYQEALDISRNLVKKNPNLGKSLKKTAHGIMAHSLFKLKKYQQAEVQYINQRNLVKKDPEYKQVTDRLAASIYKRFEQLKLSNKKIEAVEHLLKIKTLAPNSSVRVSAQFDAAAMLLQLKYWDRAIYELEELITTYVKHPLAKEFPRKLAFAYEKNEAWKQSADTYLMLFKQDPDPAVRQEALFIAAGLYKKISDRAAALKYYKRYATDYKQPFDNKMEACFHTASLYGKKGDNKQFLYWLTRIIAGDKEGDGQRTDRSRWLGAWANVKYGDHFASKFKQKKLKLPLDKSLPDKNKALQDAVTRYEMAADYEILEFITISSYKIAQLYDDFAEQLLASPRPQGLSENNLVTYKAVLDEQALHFKGLAMSAHQTNIERGWQGQFNEWIDKSFMAMARLEPQRYDRSEVKVSYGDEIR